MDNIAELLRESREEAGIELKEVSEDLKIDELILKNIEEGKIGAFKDIFTLKNYVSDYAKYLGLNSNKILNDFNEYLFEYTSKIPVQKIEKEVNQNVKEEEKVVSPYTASKVKNKKGIYIIIYILIFLLVILTIFWSINQITVDKKVAYIVSYRK